MARPAAPALPFFEAIWELLRPAGLMRLLLAEQIVDGERCVLAGSMLVMFGSTVSYAFNARLREGLHYDPTTPCSGERSTTPARKAFAGTTWERSEKETSD
jgi:hypothetical protein